LECETGSQEVIHRALIKKPPGPYLSFLHPRQKSAFDVAGAHVLVRPKQKEKKGKPGRRETSGGKILQNSRFSEGQNRQVKAEEKSPPKKAKRGEKSAGERGLLSRKKRPIGRSYRDTAKKTKKRQGGRGKGRENQGESFSGSMLGPIPSAGE